MRLLNSSLEKKAIKTVCSGSRGAAILLAGLVPSSFYYEPTKLAFERLSKLAQKNAKVPSYQDLITDPVLDERVRKELAKYKLPPAKSMQRCRAIGKRLDEFRRIRTMYTAFENGLKTLESNSVDADKLIDDVSNAVLEARAVASSDEVFTHVGVNDNGSGLKVVRKILKGEDGVYIKTGFKTFDSRNRGFSRSSAVIISATTGGGKSTLARQISHNMALQGARVCTVSLEMSEEEVITRDMANISRISMSKMINPKKMTAAERQKVLRSFKQYRARIRRAGGIETIMAPQGDVKIKELLYTLKPYNYDVILIDYVGLLGGVDGERQWQELSAAVRFGKRFAQSNGCVVIFLAQLSEENKIRYSQGMKEHAGNMWTWVYDPETGPNIIEVDQQKARNQQAFSFPLYIDFDIMEVRDLDENELSSYSEEAKESKSKGNKTVRGKPKSKSKNGSDDYFEL